MALDRLNINTIQRSITSRGTLDTNLFSDTFKEITTDLGNISTQWNRKLVPLLTSLPDGSLDTKVNAFKFGISGATIWGDKNATSSAPRFWNSSRSRPKTIKEILDDIYHLIDLGISATTTESTTSSTDDLEDRLDAIQIFIGQSTPLATAPGYSSTNFVTQGSPLDIAIGDLDSALGTVSGTTVVDTYTELRATEGSSTIQSAIILGRSSDGDGGEGIFIWDSTSSLTDNDGTVIKPTSTTTGRWLRQYNGLQDPSWFGISITNDGHDIDTWIDGAVSHATARIQTTDDTPQNAMTIAIAGSNIVRTDAKIIASDNANDFSSHQLNFTFSTAGISSPVFVTEEYYSPTASGWHPTLEFDSGNLNVVVSGKNSTTIDWRVAVQVFGLGL